MKKNRVLLVLIVLALIISGLLFSQDREIMVIESDGSLHSGRLRGWDLERIEVASDGVITAVPLDTVAVIYFVDGNKQIKPLELTNTVSYTLNGKTYTFGKRDQTYVLYGPDWVQIQDTELVKEFKDMDLWIYKLFNTDKIEVFREYIKNIGTKIMLNNIQHGAIKVRDFATGVAVNAVIALAAPQTAAKLAVESVTDIVKSVLLEMLDPKTYIRNMAKMNLYTCKTSLSQLIDEIETAMEKEEKTGTRDVEECLNIISRYFMIFTIYQPSKELLDETTASGKIHEQLNALEENIKKELLGKVSSDAAELLTQIETADKIYRGFEPYKTYSDEVKSLYKEFAEDMPFYTEEESALSFMKGYMGGTYETDISELENYKEAKKVDEMLERIPKSPFFEAIKPITTEITNPNAGEMILVKGGTFMMGNTRGDSERRDEQPVHEVALTYDYYIGKYEVTFDEYERYCEERGLPKPDDEGWGKGSRPVINVSWWDAIEYCNWLSIENGYMPVYDKKGNMLDENGNVTTDITQVKGYRLPTEAEWEYAARGGQNSGESIEVYHKYKIVQKYDYKYAGSNSINNVAWYDDNSNNKTHEIGQKAPNELGLYDMSGNVWEWCQDYWDSNYYDKSPRENPVNLNSASYRVLRGGSWYLNAEFCRVAYRSYNGPGSSGRYLGLRIARTRK